MDSNEHLLEATPSLGRRRFLAIAGLGAAGLTLFPFRAAQASPVFGAVTKFAAAIGANTVSPAVLDYLKRNELPKNTDREVGKVNLAVGRQGFSDLSQSTVYVPATEVTYFFYPARHKDQFNAVVHFFDGSRKKGPRLICSLDGPTLFGVAELAASVAQKNSREIAKQTLLPRSKVSVSSGRLDKSSKQPNVFKTDAGIVRVTYKTDGKGKGLVIVEAKNARGTLLAGGDYELSYRIDRPGSVAV